MATEDVVHFPLSLVLWVLFLLGALVVLMMLLPPENPLAQLKDALFSWLNLLG